METEEKTIQEATLSRIRNLVNANKIKLWNDPYLSKEDSTPNESKLLELANTLSPELELDDMEIFQGLLKLQSNALEKLKAREVLQQSGKIELKLKLDKNSKQKNPSLGSIIKVDVDSYDTGDDLAKEVSDKLEIPVDMFKLVSAGSVIKSDIRLCQQNLKPGQTVMILTVDRDSKAMQIVNEQRKILSTTKEDAELLGKFDTNLFFTSCVKLKDVRK